MTPRPRAKQHRWPLLLFFEIALEEILPEHRATGDSFSFAAGSAFRSSVALRRQAARSAALSARSLRSEARRRPTQGPQPKKRFRRRASRTPGGAGKRAAAPYRSQVYVSDIPARCAEGLTSLRL